MQLAPAPVPAAAPTAPPSAPPSGRSGAWLRGVAALALVAAVLGRAVAPALPGSRAGIAVEIEVTNRLAAWLSQAALLSFLALGAWLLWKTLRSGRLGVVLRLLAVPIGAGALTLGLLASRITLESPIALVLGAGVVIAALACAPGALASARTRAPGLVLLIAASSGGLHLVARVVAARAAAAHDAAGWTIARSVATAASVGDLVALALVVAWVAARRRIAGAAIGVGIAGCATALAVVALRGARSDATFAEVLVARAAAALSRPPMPWGPAVAAVSLDAAALLGALGVALGRGPAGAAHGLVAGLALVLLARGAADIPLAALGLLLGALLVRHSESG